MEDEEGNFFSAKRNVAQKDIKSNIVRYDIIFSFAAKIKFSYLANFNKDIKFFETKRSARRVVAVHKCVWFEAVLSASGRGGEATRGNEKRNFCHVRDIKIQNCVKRKYDTRDKHIAKCLGLGDRLQIILAVILPPTLGLSVCDCRREEEGFNENLSSDIGSERKAWCAAVCLSEGWKRFEDDNQARGEESF